MTDRYRAIANELMRRNNVARSLDMKVVDAAEGSARVEMFVRVDMGNSKGICHGGYLFTLADQTAGFAGMTRNEFSVTQSAHVTYVNPGKVGETLTAHASELARSKKSGTYDVRVEGEDGRTVALLRCQLLITGPEILPAEA